MERQGFSRQKDRRAVAGLGRWVWAADRSAQRAVGLAEEATVRAQIRSDPGQWSGGLLGGRGRSSQPTTPGAAARQPRPETATALGFGAAAWQVQPRDRYLGWNDRQRRAGLPRIVNNARFLILPWVQCRGLAARILSGIRKPLQADWRWRYGYEPVLLETFVEIPRFTGTAYRAANWIRLGQTQG
jgi:hypothetical protein